MTELQSIDWDCVVLDEAQAIKNPLTKQTREIKKLPSRMRIAMTGTPIENDLTNLWSLFDFLNKGILGSSTEFKGFCGGLSEHPERYVKLKAMVSPFLLRRVKTDKSIIADLPDKLEMTDYAALTKQRVVLYRKMVAEMEEKILQSEGIERRGLILTAILKLKQICNHPDQYLGQPDFDRDGSGKYALLREICETIRAKRERVRVLVFTQFREITEQLSDYLAELFGVRGYVLHGGTPIATRGQLVEAFQSDTYVPYMVLSVKAGGTGLNLTKASHVIHFNQIDCFHCTFCYCSGDICEESGDFGLFKLSANTLCWRSLMLSSLTRSTPKDRRAYGVVISLSVTNPRITEWLKPESVLRTPGICSQNLSFTFHLNFS